MSGIDELPRDGRSARRHRSRDLVVDALLDLLHDGVIRPTAQQVADRSGVSLRSIFRIFDDVETLHVAAASRQLQRARPLFVDVTSVGSVTDRVRAMTEINARLYEAVAPVRRAALRAAPESRVLQDQLQGVRGWLRGEIDRVFASELVPGQHPGAAGAVEAIMSFEAWDQLRTGQALSVHDAMATVQLAAERLLDVAPRPARSTSS